MTKHDLLKTLGFSQQYLDHLKKVEDADAYIVENYDVQFAQQSIDATNVIVEKSVTSFSTRLVVKQH